MKLLIALRQRIRNRIFKWIRKSTKQEIELLVAQCDKLRCEINDIKALTKVGVDFHDKYNQSWAVICVAGKPEFVKFVHLDQTHAYELMGFLKRFTRNEPIIDRPYGMPKELFLEVPSWNEISTD